MAVRMLVKMDGTIGDTERVTTSTTNRIPTTAASTDSLDRCSWEEPTGRLLTSGVVPMPGIFRCIFLGCMTIVLSLDERNSSCVSCRAYLSSTCRLVDI